MTMCSRAIALVLALLLSGLPSLAAAQAAFVLATEDAPLFVTKDETRTPLRVAKADSRLRLVTDEGEWLLVEFDDPQWGRRQGYVQRRLVTLEAMVPVDVSIREVPAPASPGTPTPIADAGARAAAATPLEPERRGMPAGLKWSGIGLLIGGGATVGIGAALQDDDCYSYDYTCDELRQGFYVFGGILAGTGAALLAIGAAKAGPPRTAVVFGPGRIMLQRRVSF
jgi:hypothetical protein